MALRYDTSEPGAPARTPHERVHDTIAAHRTPRQRLHAALLQMARDGQLKPDVDVEAFVDDIFGPPGIRTPSDGRVQPGRRV